MRIKNRYIQILLILITFECFSCSKLSLHFSSDRSDNKYKLSIYKNNDIYIERFKIILIDIAKNKEVFSKIIIPNEYESDSFFITRELSIIWNEDFKYVSIWHKKNAIFAYDLTSIKEINPTTETYLLDIPMILDDSTENDMINKINTLISNGYSCIDFLSSSLINSDTNTINILLSICQDVNVLDSSGSTPLINSVLSNNVNNILLLIDHGCDVNFPGYNGYRPIIYAIQKNNIDILKLLLQSGANPNLQDKHGATPLHYAISPGIIQLLLKHGAKSMTDNKGMTPSDHYKIRNCTECIEEIDRI